MTDWERMAGMTFTKMPAVSLLIAHFIINKKPPTEVDGFEIFMFLLL
jgi:hypothetical protein